MRTRDISPASINAHLNSINATLLRSALTENGVRYLVIVLISLQQITCKVYGDPAYGCMNDSTLFALLPLRPYSLPAFRANLVGVVAVTVGLLCWVQSPTFVWVAIKVQSLSCFQRLLVFQVEHIWQIKLLHHTSLLYLCVCAVVMLSFVLYLFIST